MILILDRLTKIIGLVCTSETGHIIPDTARWGPDAEAENTRHQEVS